MKRLLCIISGMNTGGAETFLMKIYRQLNREKYQMDFCVNTNENYYADEIRRNGGKFYVIPPKSKSPLKSFNAVRRIVFQNKYEYVMRVNEHSLSTIDLLAARMGGARKLVMRSSNSSSGSAMSIIVHKLFRIMAVCIPNVKIAPSVLAAEYTFGKRATERKKVHILRNGLAIDDFAFSEEYRNKHRAELNLHKKFVVGHVGRFDSQKNHKYMIDIFVEVLKIKKNAVLLMVGDGPLMDDMRKKVIEKGIEDSCLFVGVRRDVNELLSAMDVFLFPSLFEGMPNTVIEAQTAGLPCLISDTITKEANVCGLVHFMSLGEKQEVWSQKLIELSNPLREQAQYDMKHAGYDIGQVTKEFTNMIFNE